MPTQEQRTAPRFTIRLTEGASAYTANVESCGQINCELLDVSSGGLRGKLLNQNIDCSAIAQGADVALLSFASDSFDFMKDKTAKVAWVRDDSRQFGLQFTDGLTKDEVDALIFHFTYLFS